MIITATVQPDQGPAGQRQPMAYGPVPLQHLDHRAHIGQRGHGHAPAHGLDGPGPFVAGGDGVADVARVAAAVVHLAVAETDPGGGDLHQHVAGAGFGAFAIDEPEESGLVDDDGPGISGDDRDRVFDRFYRAPGRRGTPGAGLGLPIARATAERWGGTVRLVPSDAGSRFEVRLPLAPGGVATP